MSATLSLPFALPIVLYVHRMSARRTAPQAGHGAFRRQQGSRTDRPSHRGDGEGLRPVIVGVPLLRELRMKWSRNMPRNQRIITPDDIMDRSEEHTSELQSLMRLSYAVLCLKNKKSQVNNKNKTIKELNQLHKSQERKIIRSKAQSKRS